MKTALYFILSILTIVYVGFMSYINVVPTAIDPSTTFGMILQIISQYGGVILVFVFAFVNFFGSPLKAVFFTILILVAIAYVLTIIIPRFIGV